MEVHVAVYVDPVGGLNKEQGARHWKVRLVSLVNGTTLVSDDEFSVVGSPFLAIPFPLWPAPVGVSLNFFDLETDGALLLYEAHKLV